MTDVLDRNQVKYVAMFAMLLDHFALFFLDPALSAHYVLRCFGRISYPLFCVLFVTGFFFVRKDRYVVHIRDLTIFAFLSEPFFDYMLSGRFFDPLHQNVMFSWLLGFSMLCLLDWFSGMVIHFGIVSFFAVAAYVFRVDYSCVGILCMFLVYEIRTGWPEMRLWKLSFLPSAILALASGIPYAFGSVAVLLFYREHGMPSRTVFGKYLFYVFYPAHLLLFAVVRFFFAI